MLKKKKNPNFSKESKYRVMQDLVDMLLYVFAHAFADLVPWRGSLAPPGRVIFRKSSADRNITASITTQIRLRDKSESELCSTKEKIGCLFVFDKNWQRLRFWIYIYIYIFSGKFGGFASGAG
jgi:hypothetical protein